MIDCTLFGCLFRTSDSRETVVVFLLDAELIPAAEPVVLVALGQGAAVGQDEVRAQVGDDGAEAARPVRLCKQAWSKMWVIGCVTTRLGRLCHRIHAT